MPARTGEAVIDSARDAVVGPVETLLLARIACEGGATRSDLARDPGALLQHKLSPPEVRAAVDVGVAALIQRGFAIENRGRLSATTAGTEIAVAFTEAGSWPLVGWDQLRDMALVAKALSLGREPASRKKSLARPEGLRTAILQTTYGLTGKKNIPVAKLRAQLALVALERAFGNKIKAGFAKGAGLPSKAARTLAGQLAASPREFATDAKLIAQLAADAVGAAQTDPDIVRLTLLRRMMTGLLDAQPQADSRGARPAHALPMQPPRLVDRVANDRKPANAPSPRPGLQDFSAAVKCAAAKSAHGWPAKAFISRVWDTIRLEHDVWALSEIEFKSMLIEAHRRGVLALANADLRSKELRHDIERSATPDRNTVWHYVRVEE
jgi:hypothetical protein